MQPAKKKVDGELFGFGTVAPKVFCESGNGDPAR
jgi:hypothetical protein